ncbi:dihydropteroate synthase [Marinoscillum furvescens]|uniref:dihydropteroate synthase n=1 Tax=Marinoscillum furvescens TaxID=1026 RepID=UPI0029390CEE|nr:dihydropteroate synthase [Marinoscillum furvescens]
MAGNLLDLATPRVMGILNVTPDSFYAGSRKQELSAVLGSAEQMLIDGATFLDVGGYSSRPGASNISEGEELDRMVPVIDALSKEFPEAILSADTFRAKVARLAVDAGAHVVNDISAGCMDDRMLATVGELGVPYIAMHMRGTPQTMNANTEYDDLLKEIMAYFAERLAAARLAGIKDVIIDPGFGFAKKATQSFELLQKLDHLAYLECPVLVGVSRKSMIYKTLNISANEALNGTTVLNTVALGRGASILRVHDVKEAVEAVKLVNQLSV